MDYEERFLVKNVFGCSFIAAACFALTHTVALGWTVNKSLSSTFCDRRYRHMFIYLLTMLSIDLFVVITYPLEAYYRIKEDWRLGHLLCSFSKSIELFYLYAHPIIFVFLFNDYYNLVEGRRSDAHSTPSLGASLTSALAVCVATGLVVPTHLYSELVEESLSDTIKKIKCVYEESVPYLVSWTSFSLAFTATFLIPMCAFTCFIVLTDNQRARCQYRRSMRPYRKWLIAFGAFIFLTRSLYWISFAVKALDVVFDKFIIYIIVNSLRFALSPLAVCLDPFFCVVLVCNLQNF